MLIISHSLSGDYPEDKKDKTLSEERDRPTKEFTDQGKRPRLGTFSNKIERNPNRIRVALTGARDTSRSSYLKSIIGNEVDVRILSYFQEEMMV